VGIQSLELMPGERIWATLRGTMFTLRTLALLTVGLAYLGFLLAQFPHTRMIVAEHGNFGAQSDSGDR
jgi:hypothetical protein